MARLLFLTSIFILPLSVHGAVSIHEVAWMGDTVSANHEWIELYNSGEAAVSLDGWVLSDGINLSIPLTGTLGGGVYGVLERTSEESAPGTALMIYSGALVNTGATLQLRDANNNIVDQVAGGENWENIGGNNVTKETAQYTVGGWITAPGTPGKANATTPSAPQVVTNTKTTSSAEWSVGEVRAPLVLSRTPKTDFVLTPIVPERVFVGQTVSFSVVATGVGEQFKASLRYVWNFGDTTTREGKEVTHRYDYPGTYVVRVRGTFGTREAVGESVVTVLPVSVSLTRSETGDIQLNNDTVYPIDISLYRIRGEKVVTVPKDTIILPRGTITIPSSRLETTPRGSLVMVYDTTGASVAWLGPADRSMFTALAPERTSPTIAEKTDVSYPLLGESVLSPVPTAGDQSIGREEEVTDVVSAASLRTAEVSEPPEKERGTAWEIGVLFFLLGVIVLMWSFPKRTELETPHL